MTASNCLLIELRMPLKVRNVDVRLSEYTIASFIFCEDDFSDSNRILRARHMMYPARLRRLLIPFEVKGLSPPTVIFSQFPTGPIQL